MSVESQNEPEREVYPVSQETAPNLAQSAAADLKRSETRLGLQALHPHHPDFPKLILAAVIVLASAVMVAMNAQSFLSDSKFKGTLLSEGLREEITKKLPHDIPFVVLCEAAAAAGVGLWI